MARRSSAPAPQITIEVLGSKELSEAFGKLDRKAQEKLIFPGLERGAQVVLMYARQKAPVRTGKLRNTMFTKKGRKSRKKGIAWLVSTGTREQLGIDADDKYYYPAVVEYGGVIGAKAKSFGGALRRTLFGQRNLKRINAHPYMRPAADAAAPRVFSILKQTIARGIRQILQESKVRS